MYIGMVAHNGTLYVLSQDAQQLLTFHTSTGTYIGALITNMPDAPEQIMMSPC